MEKTSMKILQVNSVCGIGSTGRIASDIHGFLLAKQQESFIGFGRNNPKSYENSIRIGSKIDIYIHVFLTRIFDRHGWGSKRATIAFIDKLRILKPDIIHLHNIHGYYLNYKLLFEFIKKNNIPVVWTLHDCWSFTGHCAHFDFVGCEKWKKTCYKCPQKKEYPKSFFFDSSHSNFETKKTVFSDVENLTFITPSEWLANQVKASFLKNYPIQVINNGIDLHIYKPTISDFRSQNRITNSFVILGVAFMWGKRKGLDFFYELSKKLESDEIIVLVGLTKKQISSLPPKIIGLERTNDIQSLVKIYSAADVFVNPTLEEVFGMTNIEAIACGTPVITFNSGGSPECLDRSTGVVVEKGNLLELRNAILRIKNKEIVFHKTELIQRAKSFFSKEDRLSDYYNVYERILQK
jgi:putative colanic acid biosynthesis glycosyltransferase